MSENERVQCSVWVNKDLRHRLKIATAKHSTNISELTRDLWQAWLDRHGNGKESDDNEEGN